MGKKQRIPRKLKKKCRKDLILAGTHLPKLSLSVRNILEQANRTALVKLLTSSSRAKKYF
jgi:hypothetical protein